jgi:PPOX class probable F420-dependent enzyme
MTPPQIEEFLAQPGQLMRLGTVDADGTPRVVPTWFLHTDGRLWFTPRERSAFLANVRRDPRIGISIDEEPHPYRKVTIQGTASLVHDVGADDLWRDLYRAIVIRYITSQAAAEAYVQDTIDQPRALYSLDLSQARVTTWRNPMDDEQLSTMWARRYYRADTKLARAVAGSDLPTPDAARPGWYAAAPTITGQEEQA